MIWRATVTGRVEHNTEKIIREETQHREKPQCWDTKQPHSYCVWLTRYGSSTSNNRENRDFRYRGFYLRTPPDSSLTQSAAKIRKSTLSSFIYMMVSNKVMSDSWFHFQSRNSKILLKKNKRSSHFKGPNTCDMKAELTFRGMTNVHTCVEVYKSPLSPEFQFFSTLGPKSISTQILPPGPWKARRYDVRMTRN